MTSLLTLLFSIVVSRHFVYYKYYWYNHVIHVSDDIGDADEFKWQLLICMFCAWLITYLCLFRGIKSSGKVSGRVYCFVTC